MFVLTVLVGGAELNDCVKQLNASKDALYELKISYDILDRGCMFFFQQDIQLKVFLAFVFEHPPQAVELNGDLLFVGDLFIGGSGPNRDACISTCTVYTLKPASAGIFGVLLVKYF